tara:strand:+ start:688 stop:2976 length:2289 start_codon:yes stop_codon:yes gene_type:complete
MNYFDKPSPATDEPNDVFLRPGDAFEVFGKVFIVSSRSSNPPGFIVSDPDRPGDEKKVDSASIKDWWARDNLRFISREEFGLPIGIRESLRRTLRAFKPHERREMFRRLRYCQAIDALGPEFSRSASAMQPVCNTVARERNDTGSHSWSSVYRWWKVWTRAGRDVRALNPSQRRRGNRSERLPDYMVRALEIGRQNWLSLSQPLKSTSYKLVVKHCVDFHGGKAAVEAILRDNADAHLWPSYKTFCTACNDTDRTERLVRRFGQQAARYEMHPLGEGPVATYPFQRVEADFKYLRLFVVDEDTKMPLGTPYLMAAIDCYTGVIAGYDIGFDPPSFVSASRCLRHVIESKSDEIKNLPRDEDGLPIVQGAYPVNGVPYQFFLDNDRAFHAQSLEQSAKALGCHIDYVPRAEPWQKGKIERFWGSVQTSFLDMFPGKVLRIGKTAAHEYNPEKDAVLTLAELRLLITKAIVDVHHEGIEPDENRKRIDLWNEGVAINPPRPVRDRQSVLELVGAYVTRKAERRGIALFGLRYNSEELRNYRSGFKTDPRVEIRYDPQDISEIWIIDQDKGISFAVPCTRRDYAKGISEYQHLVIRRHALDKAGPNRKLQIKQLLLAKVELYELGLKLIKSKSAARSRKAVARYLGLGRSIIDEMNQPVENPDVDGHLDLDDDEPEDREPKHRRTPGKSIKKRPDDQEIETQTEPIWDLGDEDEPEDAPEPPPEVPDGPNAEPETTEPQVEPEQQRPSRRGRRGNREMRISNGRS